MGSFASNVGPPRGSLSAWWGSPALYWSLATRTHIRSDWRVDVAFSAAFLAGRATRPPPRLSRCARPEAAPRPQSATASNLALCGRPRGEGARYYPQLLEIESCPLCTAVVLQEEYCSIECTMATRPRIVSLLCLHSHAYPSHTKN